MATSIARRGGIYLIAGPGGGVYLGSAQAFGKRWTFHRSLLRRGKHHSPHLQHAHDKYGMDALHFMVLAFVDDPAELYAVEQSWLDFVFAVVPRHRIYNVAPSADGARGRKASPEARAKMSAFQRGRPKSEGTRQRMSEGRKGMKFTAEHSRNIALGKGGGKVYTLVDPQGRIYDGVVNLTAFTREHGLPRTGLWQIIRGRSQTCRGWRLFIGAPPVKQETFSGLLIDF